MYKKTLKKIIIFFMIICSMTSVNIFANNNNNNKEVTFYFVSKSHPETYKYISKVFLYELPPGTFDYNQNETKLANLLDNMSDKQLASLCPYREFYEPFNETLTIDKLKSDKLYYTRVYDYWKNEIFAPFVFAPSVTSNIHPKQVSHNMFVFFIKKEKKSRDGQKFNVPAKGALFRLYKYGSVSEDVDELGNGVKQENLFISDENGIVTVGSSNDIPLGYYYLVEEKTASSNMVINPEVANCKDNKLFFINIPTGFVIPEGSKLIESPPHPAEEINNNGIIYNYESPKIYKKLDSTINNEYHYTIVSSLPPNLVSYQNIRIIDKPSDNLKINYNTITITEADNNIDSYKYDITENLDGGFTIHLNDEYLDYFAEKHLNIRYTAHLKNGENEKVTNEAILKVIDPLGEPKNISDNVDDNPVSKYEKRFIKKSSNNMRLKGAEFIVQNSNGLFLDQSTGQTKWTENFKEATKFISNEAGEFSVKNLSLGSYRLFEVKAPYGYIKIKEPVDFEITADKQDMLKEEIIINKPDKQLNETSTTLPNTGLLNETILKYLISMLILLAITKRRKGYEIKKYKDKA